MNLFLSHVNLEPLFYGVIVAIGLMVVAYHLFSGRFGAVIVDLAVFILVFWMHGGTLTGGMAAAVAALVCGLFIPPFVRYLLSRKD